MDSSSVWYGAVVRGDRNIVQIGRNSCIKDRAVINTVSELPTGLPANVVIGTNVSVGPAAVVTSSVLEDQVQIGAGAIVSEGCVVGKNSIVAAGAMLPAGTLIPANQFWAGHPATYQRDVSEEEVQALEAALALVKDVAREHAAEFLDHGFAYVEAEKAGIKP
jgi:carbonic anhydrase/acetyltransferase-like protein (isoleucine patch superfamily)